MATTIDQARKEEIRIAKTRKLIEEGIRADISYREFKDEIAIYANTPKGVDWIKNNIKKQDKARVRGSPCFSLSKLHYANKQLGNEVLTKIEHDGLVVSELSPNPTMNLGATHAGEYWSSLEEKWFPIPGKQKKA